MSRLAFSARAGNLFRIPTLASPLFLDPTRDALTGGVLGGGGAYLAHNIVRDEPAGEIVLFPTADVPGAPLQQSFFAHMLRKARAGEAVTLANPFDALADGWSEKPNQLLRVCAIPLREFLVCRHEFTLPIGRI